MFWVLSRCPPRYPKDITIADIPLATFEAAAALRSRQGFTALQIHGSEGFSAARNVTEAVRRNNVSVLQQM